MNNGQDVCSITSMMTKTLEMIMTMVDIHEHVNLHILNIQAPMKPLMKKNTTKIDVQNEGGRPLWMKHDEAKGAEWGSRNNPGRSHRNPMLEELKDEFAKDERHQRRIWWNKKKQNIFQAL